MLAPGFRPDRIVTETELSHPIDRIEVSPIDNHRRLEQRLDALKVGMPVFVPVGDHRQRPGDLREVEFRVAPVTAPVGK